VRDLVMAVHWLRLWRRNGRLICFGHAWECMGRSWTAIDWERSHQARRYQSVRRILLEAARGTTRKDKRP
jgi:hypothetical protein